MRKSDAREIAVIGGKFLLIGPPIGALLVAVSWLRFGQLEVGTGAIFFLLGIPVSYLMGGLPALVTGLAYGLAGLHMPRLAAALVCAVVGAISSAAIYTLDLPELNRTLTITGALSSLLTAALCRPPRRTQAEAKEA